MNIQMPNVYRNNLAVYLLCQNWWFITRTKCEIQLSCFADNVLKCGLGGIHQLGKKNCYQCDKNYLPQTTVGGFNRLVVWFSKYNIITDSTVEHLLKNNNSLWFLLLHQEFSSDLWHKYCYKSVEPCYFTTVRLEHS